MIMWKEIFLSILFQKYIKSLMHCLIRYFTFWKLAINVVNHFSVSKWICQYALSFEKMLKWSKWAMWRDFVHVQHTIDKSLVYPKYWHWWIKNRYESRFSFDYCYKKGILIVRAKCNLHVQAWAQYKAYGECFFQWLKANVSFSNSIWGERSCNIVLSWAAFDR